MALTEAKKLYEANLDRVKRELLSEHIQEKSMLTQQIQQLEESLAKHLQGLNQNGPRVGRSGHSRCGMEVDRNHVKRLLEATICSIKKDVAAIVSRPFLI